MDFVLSSSKCKLNLLSRNQSTKVKKSLFRCSSIVFIFLCWKSRQLLPAYNIYYNKHYLQLVACRWNKLKRSVGPKLNLVAHHILLMLYPNLHFPYWVINFLFERYDVYHLIVSSAKLRKGIFLNQSVAVNSIEHLW